MTQKRKKSSVRTATKRKGRPQTNPNSLANLKPPFQPGQSGNPGGRPKLLGDAYKAKLAKIVPGDDEGRTYAEVMADAIALRVRQQYNLYFQKLFLFAKAIVKTKDGH